MYIHIGNDVSIKSDDIIGIFDIDNSTISKITRDYLAKTEKKGKIINVSGDIPKSFILTGKKGEEAVYLSQLASSTLKKRSVISKHGKDGYSLIELR